MSYQVKDEKDGYSIVEKGSELLIAVHKKEKTARSMCRSLNLGAGFSGFTPIFFAIQPKEKAITEG